MRGPALVVLATALVLAACGGGDGEDETVVDSGGGGGSGANQAPTITGSPQTEVMVGSAYSFEPSADDADGDTLTFSVTNLPSWATFNASTGAISGTPKAGDVATYDNIQISVSDGTASASLAAFSISVVATASGSASLSWVAPTENTDGSPLGSDLAGYKIYWGPSEGNYTSSVRIDNPGLTTYTISELTAGTWYFVATAFNQSDVESQYSNVASKQVM